MAVANIIGTLIGVVFNTFFVPDSIDKNPTPQKREEYKNACFSYVIGEAILCILFSLPTIILFRSKPPHAPSVSQNNISKHSFMQSCKMLFSNRNFICLLIINTIIVGYFNLFGTILNQFANAYEITNQTQTSIIGGVSNILSLIATIILSIVVDHYKRYKPMFVSVLAIALVAQIVMTILLSALPPNSTSAFWIITICVTLVMCACVPFFAIGMDYVCEITYPVGELISGGFILAGSQILGVLQTFLCSYFIQTLKKPFYVNLLVTIQFIIAFLILLILKEDLIRNNAEKNSPVENLEYEDVLALKDKEKELIE